MDEMEAKLYKRMGISPPQYFDDRTMVTKVIGSMRMKPCAICGELEEYTVMGPAVGLSPMPSACASHVEQVRALARGEQVTVQLEEE